MFSLEKGDGCNTSLLRLPSHVGTHLDAPYHIIQTGQRVDEISLEVMIGRAQVVDFTRATGPISQADLEAQKIEGMERVLIRTIPASRPADLGFDTEFEALGPDGAEYLVEQGVRLVGIDCLSIEPFKPEGTPVHQILLSHEVVVVEGLDLSQIPAGEVEFICLPLKIQGSDGSPCRAVARPI